ADRAARSARRDRIGWRGFDAATAVAALETEVAVMAAPVVGGPDEPAWGEVGARSTAPLPSTDGWTRICFGADPGGQEEVPGEPDPLASSAEAAGCPVEKGADDAPGGLVTVRRQSPDRPAETGLRPALTEGTAGHSVEKSADPSPGGLATTRPGSP
ncbi:hypothetical protein INQ23_23885, partial [Escherichia coli]|nr:hypothetical protein [Escherichia coli]